MVLFRLSAEVVTFCILNEVKKKEEEDLD